MTSTSGAGFRAAQGDLGHPSGRRIAWRNTPKALSASLLDIDVSLTDIVFQRFENGFDGLGERRPSSLVDYAIEGVVHSGAAEGDGPSDPFLVYLSGYAQADRMDRYEDFDQRSVCYIATDLRPDYAWRANIYIERALFRRLVELYVSRRIDAARISVLLKVLRDPSGAVEVPSLDHPMLRFSHDRHDRHSRAHLMSVQTSLGAPKGRHAAVARSPAWGARMGRQQALASQS